MRIDDYSRSGYLDNRINSSAEKRGYENLKRQGTVKITSVDGTNMNVFFMYGESAGGDIKIYTDKNNGKITLKGKKEITSEDINYFKEDVSEVMEKAKRVKEKSTEDNFLVEEKELGFILMGEEELESDGGEFIEDEHLFKGIVFDREKIESDGKLEEYLELKNLIDKTKNNKMRLSNMESSLRLGIDNLSQEETKIKDIDMAHDLFEVVKVKIHEDKLLLSKIRDNKNKTVIYDLLK